MGKVKPSSEEASQSQPESFLKKPSKFNKDASPSKVNVDSDSQEVLIKVGGFEYKTPTKKTRIFIASLVIGLNLLLVIAVLLYFYNPWFKDFIYNVGRA